MSLSALLHEPIFWGTVAMLCAVALMALVIPPDAEVDHDDEPPQPPIIFPPF